MKFFFFLLAFFPLASFAQSSVNKLPPVDKSPLDISYFPVNYPVLKIQDKISEPPVARVIYSRPVKNNRQVFGELVEFNRVWRLGANEATEIEFFRDVCIGGKKIPKGKYTLYALVTPTQWTMILNTETDTWGAFKYDSKKDVVRIPVEPTKLQQPAETFSIFFEKAFPGANLVMVWDDVRVEMPVDLRG